MTLLLTRILLTVVLVLFGWFALHKIWTRPIDIAKLFGGIAEQIPVKTAPFGFETKSWIVTRAAGHPNVDGKLVILLWQMAIVNLGEKATTLNKLTFLYKMGGEERASNLRSMPVTREVEGQKDVNAIVITNRQDNLILVGFINFQDELDKNDRKETGGVWAGSACFLLEEQSDRFEELSDLRLVIEDFIGQKTVVSLNIKDATLYLRPGWAFRVGAFKKNGQELTFD